MQIENVVRQVTVRGQADGLDKVTQGYTQVATSADGANVSVTRQAASAAAADAALAKLSAQMMANLAQQQHYAEMYAAQANALASMKAANDNAASSYHASGLELAEWANHLRQGAEAAYAFSPAFRGLVNAMAPQALEAAGIAIAAVAGGIVTAVNYTGTGLVVLANAAEKVSPNFLGLTSGVRAAGLAMEAFSPAADGVVASVFSIAGAVVTRILPIVGQIILLRDAIKLVGEAWELGAEKLKEYVDLSARAASLGVSTDFLQRLTKAAEDAEIPVKALTDALARMQESLAPKLGGSDGLKELDRLASYGNFKGNTGVTELQQATTSEQQFQAAIDFYRQATDASQKLAALDVMKTIFGDNVAKNLAADDQYLQTIKARMADIDQTDLVKQDDIDRAVALQNRLDAAEKILSERWHPIQGLLIEGGIQMRQIWVDIVENIAAAVDYIVKLFDKISATDLSDIKWIAEKLSQSATAFMNLTTTEESRRAAEAQFGISSNPADIALAAARQQLGMSLQNPANVAASRHEMLTISEQMRPDNSIATKPDDNTGAYDRAKESMLKYIEVSDAAAKSVDAGVAEQERLKAIADLTAGGLKDGLTRAAAMAKAEMSGLAEQAAAAAEALAKAKIAAEIRFGANTALLSSEDVSIATQLKGIYPDVATALASVEAQGLRVNTAMRSISSTIESNLTSGLTDIVSGTKSVGQGFSDMSTAMVKAIEEMIIKIEIVEPMMRALQASMTGAGGSVNLLGIFGGPAAPVTTGLDALAAIHHAGGIVGDLSMPMRYINPAYFDDAPRYHAGGIVGDEVPIIARRGEEVGWPSQLAQKYGATAPNIVIHNHTEASPQVSRASNGDVTITLKKMVDGMIGDSLSTGTGRRVLSDQYGVKPFTGQ